MKILTFLFLIGAPVVFAFQGADISQDLNYKVHSFKGHVDRGVASKKIEVSNSPIKVDDSPVTDRQLASAAESDDPEVKIKYWKYTPTE